MANRRALTGKRREKFLESLRACCNVTLAARSIGVSRRTAYHERERDPAFARAWDEAVEEGLDALEAEAHRRAVLGFERPVYQRGELVGTEMHYSDVLLLNLLRAYRPRRFKAGVEELGEAVRSNITWNIDLGADTREPRESY